MAGDVTLTCEDFRDMAAAVALHATDADDARRVEEHAARCPTCRAWFDELSATAAALGTLVPQVDPPAALRARVLDAARRESKPLPLVRRLWPGSVRRPRLSAAWLVAAASFIVAIASLAWSAHLEVELSDMRAAASVATDRVARVDRVVNVLASDQLSVMPLQPAATTVTSSGYVFLDPGSGTGMLMCHHLPPVSQGHAYQIWFVRGTDRVSAGMLWPDTSGDGYTMIQIPPDVQSFDSIGLTEEPGSGSRWPTSPRVIGTPLKS